MITYIRIIFVLGLAMSTSIKLSCYTKSAENLFKEQNKVIDTLTQTNTTLKDQVAQLTAENEQLKQTATQATLIAQPTNTETAANEALEKENASLKDQVVQLTTENSNLKQDALQNSTKLNDTPNPSDNKPTEPVMAPDIPEPITPIAPEILKANKTIAKLTEDNKRLLALAKEAESFKSVIRTKQNQQQALKQQLQRILDKVQRFNDKERNPAVKQKFNTLLQEFTTILQKPPDTRSAAPAA